MRTEQPALQVLMVATDVYRPAAIEQLHKLGERVGVPVYDQGKEASPVDVARRGVAKARDEGFDAVIIDTAGRLQVSWIGIFQRSSLGGMTAVIVETQISQCAHECVTSWG